MQDITTYRAIFKKDKIHKNSTAQGHQKATDGAGRWRKLDKCIQKCINVWLFAQKLMSSAAENRNIRIKNQIMFDNQLQRQYNICKFIRVSTAFYC